MKYLAAAMLAAFAVPVWAQDGAPVSDAAGPVAEVIKRDENGRAVRIRVEGFEYDVCGEGQQDGCINPREAGLDFGGVPIDYWPGQPASETDERLPPEAPPPEEGD